MDDVLVKLLASGCEDEECIVVVGTVIVALYTEGGGSSGFLIIGTGGSGSGRLSGGAPRMLAVDDTT